MIICGIDEAGRGPLAGPVVAACVVMRESERINGVMDSKKLSGQKREYLFEVIMNKAVEVRTGLVWNDEIDYINILQATMKSMHMCLTQIINSVDKFFIDGNYFKLPGDKQNSINFETVVKGDEKIHCISCASIIAKVTRDRIMEKLHLELPEYNFFSNKGYATKSHIASIKQIGVSKYHRISFCKNFISPNDRQC